jgi:DNA-binding response OmpR family regulator
MPRQKRVIVLESDTDFRVRLIQRLSQNYKWVGFIGARTLVEADVLMTADPADLLIIDLNGPDIEGLPTLQRLKADYPRVELLPLINSEQDDFRRRIHEAGIAYVLEMPFPSARLAKTVTEALTSPRLFVAYLSAASEAVDRLLPCLDHRETISVLIEGKGRTGEIHLADGKLLDAVVEPDSADAGPRQTGDAAVESILSWRDCRLFVRSLAAPPPLAVSPDWPARLRSRQFRLGAAAAPAPTASPAGPAPMMAAEVLELEEEDFAGGSGATMMGIQIDEDGPTLEIAPGRKKDWGGFERLPSTIAAPPVTDEPPAYAPGGTAMTSVMPAMRSSRAIEAEDVPLAEAVPPKRPEPARSEPARSEPARSEPANPVEAGHSGRIALPAGSAPLEALVGRKIGKVLFRMGCITEDDLRAALNAQNRSRPPRKLGRILMEMGACTLEELHQALANQKGVRPEDIVLDVEDAESDATVRPDAEPLKIEPLVSAEIPLPALMAAMNEVAPASVEVTPARPEPKPKPRPEPVAPPKPKAEPAPKPKAEPEPKPARPAAKSETEPARPEPARPGAGGKRDGGQAILELLERVGRPTPGAKPVVLPPADVVSPGGPLFLEGSRDGEFVSAEHDSLADSPGGSGLTEKPPRVLVLESDAGFRADMVNRIRRRYKRVAFDEAGDPEEAARLIADEVPSVLLADLGTPGLDAVKAVGGWRSAHPGMVLIAVRRKGHPEALKHAVLEAGANYCLDAPFRSSALRAVLREALTAPRVFLCRPAATELAHRILEWVELPGATVALSLENAGQTGEVFVRDGALLDAVVGETRGDAALRQMIEWPEPYLWVRSVENPPAANLSPSWPKWLKGALARSQNRIWPKPVAVPPPVAAPPVNTEEEGGSAGSSLMGVEVSGGESGEEEADGGAYRTPITSSEAAAAPAPKPAAAPKPPAPPPPPAFRDDFEGDLSDQATAEGEILPLADRQEGERLLEAAGSSPPAPLPAPPPPPPARGSAPDPEPASAGAGANKPAGVNGSSIELEDGLPDEETTRFEPSKPVPPVPAPKPSAPTGLEDEPTQTGLRTSRLPEDEPTQARLLPAARIEDEPTQFTARSAAGAEPARPGEPSRAPAAPRVLKKVCDELVADADDALAAEVIDLSSGLPLARHRSRELPEEFGEMLTAGVLELFRGRTVRRVDDVARRAMPDAFPVMEEALLTGRGLHVFLRRFPAKDALMLLVTRRGGNPAMCWVLMKSAMSKLAPELPDA